MKTVPATPRSSLEAGISSRSAARTLACPACGKPNPTDAVFCANPECHKALGDFKYVREELLAEAKWHEALAEKVTAFVGTPRFLALHVIWFVLWVAVNTGVITIVVKFDDYPFFLLDTLLAVEAIFLSGFVLISNMRQNTHANKRAELDYEVSVRIHRDLQQLRAMSQLMAGRLEELEKGLGRGSRGPVSQ